MSIARIRTATVRAEGDRVQVMVDGKLLADLPWQAADDLATAIRAKAREAEEHAKAPAIANDAAILLRAGARFGLSSDPRILAEAAKRAAWDTKLRRYMPGGIKGEVLFGRPSVTAQPPKKEDGP